MRRRRAELRGRVNGNLAFRFAHTGLTSHAGLEFFRRYLAGSGVGVLLRQLRGPGMPRTDFGVPRMVLVLLALLISGGRRLRHLRYLDGDPLVLRLCGLTRLPSPRTAGRWLRALRGRHLPRLHALNATVVARAIRATGTRRLTIDVDGSVVSTGPRVRLDALGQLVHPQSAELLSDHGVRGAERPGAARAESAGQRPRRQSGRALSAELLAQLTATLGTGYRREFRMDGAFCRRDVITLLDRAGAEYAIKMPFYPWLGLRRGAGDAGSGARARTGRQRVAKWRNGGGGCGSSCTARGCST
jgi:hypothetical protein